MMRVFGMIRGHYDTTATWTELGWELGTDNAELFELYMSALIRLGQVRSGEVRGGQRRSGGHTITICMCWIHVHVLGTTMTE